MRRIIKKISQDTINRYSVRYRVCGYNVITLGWGTMQQQKKRFAATIFNKAFFSGRTVLDIGCGFGDYFAFLNKNNVKIKRYSGWDINPELILEAKKRLPKKIGNASFRIKDILGQRVNAEISDIVVMLGVMNFNLKKKFNNYEYSKLCIKRAFSCARKVLIVDFLSNRLADSYSKEDFVFYHDPCKMLKFALTLSEDVILKHNYAPIPQKEFMLFIFKENIRI